MKSTSRMTRSECQARVFLDHHDGSPSPLELRDDDSTEPAITADDHMPAVLFDFTQHGTPVKEVAQPAFQHVLGDDRNEIERRTDTGHDEPEGKESARRRNGDDVSKPDGRDRHDRQIDRIGPADSLDHNEPDGTEYRE